MLTAPFTSEFYTIFPAPNADEFIDLIDIFSDEYFDFKEGDINLRMIIKGTRNKPILNGFILINDSEIDFYKNKIKDINSLIIFDFDYLEIKNLKAKAEGSGNIFIRGLLTKKQRKNMFPHAFLLFG